MRTRWLTTEPKLVETYRGINMHADTGLHAQMAELVTRHLAKGAQVIDVGAGAGAFTERLVDLGYAVTPVDVDPEKWQASVPLQVVDLNIEVPDTLRGRFDAAVAMEVIEHVENPWQFAREMATLLRPGGLLFLSTPNVASFLSRAIFLRNGRFHQFDEVDLSYGHISPLTPFELQTIADRTGWERVDERPGGYLPVFDATGRKPRMVASNALRLVAYLLARGPKDGWCRLYVWRRLSRSASR